MTKYMPHLQILFRRPRSAHVPRRPKLCYWFFLKKRQENCDFPRKCVKILKHIQKNMEVRDSLIKSDACLLLMLVGKHHHDTTKLNWLGKWRFTYSLKDVSNQIHANRSSHEYSQQRVSVLYFKLKINCVATVPVHLQNVSSREAFKRLTDYSGTMIVCESSQNQY